MPEGIEVLPAPFKRTLAGNPGILYGLNSPGGTAAGEKVESPEKIEPPG